MTGQRWQRQDGQWFIRETGTHKRPSFLKDDQPWDLEGKPFVIDRPIYPDAPAVVHVEPTKDEEKPPVPAPSQPAIDVDVLHPSIPKAVKTMHALALAHGWTVRLTRATGPKVDQHGNVVDEKLHTLALRCAKPGGRRVVFLWVWAQAREGTEKGLPKHFPAGWASDGAYDAPFHPCTHTSAKEALSAT